MTPTMRKVCQLNCSELMEEMLDPSSPRRPKATMARRFVTTTSESTANEKSRNSLPVFRLAVS